MQFEKQTSPLVESINSATTVRKLDVWPEPNMEIFNRFREKPPVFPLEYLGKWGEWARQQAELMSAPADYVAGALLGAGAGLIGNARWVRAWGNWEQPAVLWIGLCGDASTGKTPGIDIVFDIITSKIEPDLAEDHKGELARIAGKVEDAKYWESEWQKDCVTAQEAGRPSPTKPEKALMPEMPQRPRYVISDITSEKIGSLFPACPKGFITKRQELAGWIGGFDRYGGGSDRQFWLECYDGKSFTIDRVKLNEPINIPNLSISVIGGIQPDRLQSMLVDGDDDGFLARLLMIWPDKRRFSIPKHGVPTAPIEEKLRQLASLKLEESYVNESGRSESVPKVVPLSADAIETLGEWRQERQDFEDGLDGKLLSHQGKLYGAVLRLALILEFLNWELGDPEPKFVSKLSVVRAIALADDYFFPMARRVYQDAGLSQVERDASRIAKAILRNSVEGFNARDLSRGYIDGNSIQKFKSTSRRDSALDLLIDAGVIAEDPAREGETPGKKAKNYLVNPKIFEIGVSTDG